MQVRKVIPSGFCKGVVNAIKIANDTRNNYPDKNIYVLGMIVHNDFVTKQLEDIGIITLDDTNKTKDELLDNINDGVVIFTAHGISDSIKKKAQDKGLICVDATCVDVLKTKDTIIEHLNDGYDVIYFGKKNHPEAEAILSISDSIYLITSKDDLDKLNISNDKVFMTNQTTMSYLQLKELIDYAKLKYPNLLVEEEICNATSSRQKAITDLKDCDLLYVVGDKKSNNTNKLAEIAINSGIGKVSLIQNYKDINNDDLKDVENVYVTAGASTPPILIEEVMNYLKEID